MTTGMLQDTIQTTPSGSGPRFRPYACPNHHVTKGRYITSNDSRGYIPVYEYPLNGQWIMMDIDDGYILWTGIWKALGNSKADIVKMIDSQPDLAPLIRRVRGGYLKIQGTWMPYEVALKLSRRVAWMIRDDLVPLFGPTFPSTCLSPDQPGYGQVVPTSQNRRRARRTTQNSIMEVPRAPNGWTVVTPNVDMVAPCNTREQPGPFHPVNVRSSDYHMASPYTTHSQIRGGSTSSDIRLSPIRNIVNVKSSSSLDSHRFGGYSGHPPPSYRNLVPPRRASHSLAVGLRDDSSESHLKEEFNLPPIHAPDCNNSRALPPISTIEDVRGIAPQDSAAVLRRLRMDDDDGYSKAGRFTEDRTWGRRHSSAQSSSKSLDASPRFQPYSRSRLHSEHAIDRDQSLTLSHYHRVHANNGAGCRAVRSDASQYSHEGDSTSNPSPISPTTPSSSLSENDNYHPHTGNMDQGKPFPEYADRIHHHWSTPHPDKQGRIMEKPETISVRRNSSSDGDFTQPHRPW